MSYEELFNILLSDKPSIFIKEYEKDIFFLIPNLSKCKGFNQNNSWHIYDVYEHILHVVDGVTSSLPLRLAALFHDIGKPFVYIEDQDGVGHFYNHWIKSNEIFQDFAQKCMLEQNLIETVSKLIFYHDINLEKISALEEMKIVNTFKKEELIMLFQLKRSDLLAQNSEYHDLLNNFQLQEKRLLLKYYMS